ncbi:MAG: hypothetical protein FWE24_09220 [Defluviitaleaceae bacterium]|nr:hypothetical protein [Defluviitaleaceae bacterium]
MKEYKGIGNKITTDGENVLIKHIFLGEKCTLSDITDIKWVAPTYKWPTYGHGRIEIRTRKRTHKIAYTDKQHESFVELHNIIASRIGLRFITFSDDDREKNINIIKNRYSDSIKILAIGYGISAAILLLRSCASL